MPPLRLNWRTPSDASCRQAPGPGEEAAVWRPLVDMLKKPSIDDFPSLAIVELSLSDKDHKCIYYLPSERRRCKNKIYDADRAAAASRLQRSFDPQDIQHVDIETLKDFARLNCCKSSHRHKLDDTDLIDPLALRWQAELRACTTIPRTLATMTLHAGSRQSIPLQQQRYNLRSRSAPQESSSSVIGATTNADTSGFRPHLVSPSHTVATVLAKPLTRRDQLSGILYLYTRASSPGYVKIGLTTKSIQARFDAWSRDCGYTPLLAESFANVPHIYRVEQLVHFELAKYWRLEKQCQKCPKQHKEWFEIAATKAGRVAGQWAEWMTVADPYEPFGTLKESWKKAIRSLQAVGVTVTAQALLDTHNTQQQRTTTFTETGSARIRSSFAEAIAPAGGLGGESIADTGSLEAERTATRFADISTAGLELVAAATATTSRTFEDCVKAIAETIQALTKQQQDDLLFELVRRSSTRDGDAVDQVSTLSPNPERLERHNTNPTLTACA
ncbi:hypothetical protein LTR70_005892 [Exophiala xenobiotica]|nr:hypothetical protein LTR70_005892 [Exophiala xenobiotica]